MIKILQIIIVRFDPWLARLHDAHMAAESSKTAKERQDARVRKWVVAVLVFIATVLLVEVVIAPGSMIRNHLHPAPDPFNALAEATAPADGEAASDSLLRDQFLNLYKDEKKQLDVISTYARERFQIDLTSVDAKKPPAFLMPAIHDSPSVEAIWSQLAKDAAEAARVLSNLRSSIITSDILNAKRSMSVTDRSLLRESVDELSNTQITLKHLKAEMEHLAPFGGETNLLNSR